MSRASIDGVVHQKADEEENCSQEAQNKPGSPGPKLV
jgi:hypothetical protein